MQKSKYIFKDIICVEKVGGENIYVFTRIYTNYCWKYTQEAANTGCFQEEKVNGRATEESFL